jgi:hypothetical protein
VPSRTQMRAQQLRVWWDPASSRVPSLDMTPTGAALQLLRDTRVGSASAPAAICIDTLYPALHTMPCRLAGGFMQLGRGRGLRLCRCSKAQYKFIVVSVLQ